MKLWALHVRCLILVKNLWWQGTPLVTLNKPKSCRKVYEGMPICLSHHFFFFFFAKIFILTPKGKNHMSTPTASPAF